MEQMIEAQRQRLLLQLPIAPPSVTAQRQAVDSTVVKTISIADEMEKERASAAPGFVIPTNNPWQPQNFCWSYTGQPYNSPGGQNFNQAYTKLPDIPGPAAMQPSAGLANPCSGTDGLGKGAGSRKEKQHQTGEPTTIFFRNVPNNYNGKKILELFDKSGFKNGYDFVYVPHDFKRLPSLVNLGYFFVNFVDHEKAVKALEQFEGFNKWSMDSTKVLSASWATQTQGQKACIKRYRNCPVMHETVPVECKPMVFQDGVMVTFGPSKKKIKQPRFKKGLFPEPGEDLPGKAEEDAAEEEEEEEASEEFPAKEERLEEMVPRDSSASLSSVVWMPDESACSCSVCDEPFTMFRRRHHCRACGIICCAECAPRTSSAWPSLLTRTQTTFKRLCKECGQGFLPSSPLSPTYVKNTFIDVKEAHTSSHGVTFTQSRLADSFPF